MKHYIGASNPMREQFNPQANYVAEHFSWSFEGGVGTVTLNRPDRQNAINGEMLVRMYDAFVAADTDPGIRTLILTGAGGNFCSGADLKEMAGGHSGDTGGPPDRVVGYGAFTFVEATPAPF